jgi:hypothetical protein
MGKIPVRLIGGPLDGQVFDLKGKPGEQMELNSAAGVCVYEFATADNGEAVMHFVGPGWPARN